MILLAERHQTKKGQFEMANYKLSFNFYHFKSFYCSSLTNIEIPNSVTTIGNNAFSRCEGLKVVTIPDSVTSIGHSVFKYCPKLTTIKYTGTQEQWDALLESGYGAIWNSDLEVNVIYNYQEQN